MNNVSGLLALPSKRAPFLLWSVHEQYWDALFYALVMQYKSQPTRQKALLLNALFLEPSKNCTLEINKGAKDWQPAEFQKRLVEFNAPANRPGTSAAAVSLANLFDSLLRVVDRETDAPTRFTTWADGVIKTPVTGASSHLATLGSVLAGAAQSHPSPSAGASAPAGKSASPTAAPHLATLAGAAQSHPSPSTGASAPAGKSASPSAVSHLATLGSALAGAAQSHPSPSAHPATPTTSTGPSTSSGAAAAVPPSEEARLLDSLKNGTAKAPIPQVWQQEKLKLRKAGFSIPDEIPA